MTAEQQVKQKYPQAFVRKEGNFLKGYYYFVYHSSLSSISLGAGSSAAQAWQDAKTTLFS